MRRIGKIVAIWVSVMTGLVFLVQLGLELVGVEFVTDKSIAWNWWVIAFIIAVFTMMFYERRDNVRLQREVAQLREDKTPRIRCEIVRRALGELDGCGLVAAFLRVWNEGSGSAAHGYQISVKIDGVCRKAEMVSVPQAIKLGEFFYHPSDSILERTASKNISRGDEVFGLLLGRLSGVTKEDLLRSEITVELCDYLGTPYVSTPVSGGIAGYLGVLPTMSADTGSGMIT